MSPKLQHLYIEVCEQTKACSLQKQNSTYCKNKILPSPKRQTAQGWQTI